MMYNASQSFMSDACWMLQRFVAQIELTYDCVVGGGSPYLDDLKRAMTAMPKIGDLVLVIHAGKAPKTNRLGWLVRIEDVPCRAPDEGEEFAPCVRHWTIDRIDGSGEFTWYNVAVLRVIRKTREDVLVPIVRQLVARRQYGLEVIP